MNDLMRAAGLAALVTTAACASQVENPVGTEFRRAYAVEEVAVALTDEKGLPNRYDESVRKFYDEVMPEGEKVQFDAFRAGTPEDDIAEQYLVWRIDTLLNERVPTAFRGARPGDVRFDIVNTTFPNAATMMLVGEIKNLTYDLALTDAVDGDVLIETPKRVTVVGERSAGAGGGLLGMALRGNQHMNDLESLAANAAESAADFLTADTVSSTVVKRVAAYPDRIETEAPMAPAPLVMPEAPEMDPGQAPEEDGFDPLIGS